MLSTVIMDCRGLVDPHNKPFGRVLPLEIQIKIMFWVHCFYTCLLYTSDAADE